MPKTAIPEGCKMPSPWFRASNTSGTLVSIYRPDAMWDRPLRAGERKLGNFILPDFQRPPVWTTEQKVRFIESIWQRLPLGAYIVNRVGGLDSPYDGLLLDGQQRITAIMDYVADAFPVLGYLWSALTPIDQRQFAMIPMAYMETKLEDMDQIKEVYDRLAYGGTAHDPKDAEKEVYWEVVHASGNRSDYVDLDVARQEHAELQALDPSWSLVEVTRFDRIVVAGAA
ncbi:hypothetical protein MARCHEWKA_03790 [Brevundimonas phage vB_BpoS-Marchewka]|uniref:GmrSD restriction endonucleases N-terminal domain-containing protein n=1 Tax=Brevundimonas phage vB_BpoS-Marchewka TaxID=2948604 RepID=A0A9E7N634_9CAUD|nr:hypothetical protein MARCHEWKA_03790 [Brevundimonas phage vB_BpoS-Marchewka]UTC29337.1 hypothetical protein BAMBUS_02550 [Brevundimonas phage vB_BpoS-Bambus]